MANPVNNGGINAQVGVGNILDVDVKIGGSARVSENQSKGIFQSVNENYAKNPNHAPPVGQGEDRTGPRQNQSKAGEKSTPPAQAIDANPDEHTAPPARKNQTSENPATGEDGDILNRPNRGAPGKSNASEQGLLNGRGHHKTENQAQTQETPPIVIFPDEPGNGNPKTGGTQNTPPIILMPDTQGAQPTGRHSGFPPIFNPPVPNLPPMGVNFSVDMNLRAHGNQPYGVIRQVFDQVLRQNDIYLSRHTINRLVNRQSVQNWAHTQPNLPREIHGLVQNIGRQVLSMLDNSRQNRQLIHQLSKEISQQVRENIQDAKHAFLKNASLGAVHFRDLNIREKLHVAVELLPAHLPPKALENLQNNSVREVLNGLLLARGLIVPGERAADVRNLVAFKSNVLPAEVSMTALRDVGHLVKTLIADTAAAKQTANLELAVQKFVKILLANNELGVLLATVKLAAQSPNPGSLVSRSLALAEIYQLIACLIQAGEKALRQSAAEKNILPKERNIFQSVPLSSSEDFDESQNHLNQLRTNEAAGALRQFLEFNPAFVYDRSASVFNNPDDARRAQDSFIDLYQDEIARWLESGNHRFVKDFDFDKPVGVVVERGSDRFFTANRARFVLVRDGSVQGWHFLKSFLVK
jgi:hypothetical protein